MEPNHTLPQKPMPSKKDILSSAKVVADAARHRNEKMDKGKVAGAAADLLGTASHYGKLEEKGVGKCVGKAENYLRHYNSSHVHPPAGSAGGAEAHLPSGTAQSAGGHGDYIKMAQGLLKKKSDGNSSSASHSGDAGGSAAGFGDYFKMAEGLLKKH